MVGRRADEADAGRGLAHLGDPRVDLLAGQVAALAGLGALGHLDLDLYGAPQVAARDAKATGGHLLDGALLGVPVGKRGLARRVLSALAGVGAAVDAVHGDGQALVLLPADGAVAHGAGVEAREDALHGLDLVKRHGLRLGREVHEVAQGDGATGAVHPGGKLLELLVAALAASVLQQVDGLGVDEVLLAALRAPLGEAQGGQLVGRGGLGQGERGVVALGEFALDVIDAKAADARGRGREVAGHQVLGEAQHLEDLGGVIALHGGDAHLGHDGDDACRDGAVVVGLGLLHGKLDSALLAEVCDALVGHVGVAAGGGVAHQAGEVVRVDGVAGLHH